MIKLSLHAQGPSCNLAKPKSWHNQPSSLQKAIALLSTAVFVLLNRPATAMDRHHRRSVERNNLHRHSTGVASSKRRRTSSVETSYQPYPELLWTVQLDGQTVELGNAVEQSAFDDDIIYITTREASLSVLSAVNGTELALIKSGTRQEGWTTTCTSGISFGELEGGLHFLVYSLVDRPPRGSDKAPETRVVAISIPGHERLWSSSGLPGESMGSPLVYRTHDQQTYIALTHNSETRTDSTTTVKTGHFTLLRADNGDVVWTESEWRRGGSPKGYGPPGIAPSPILGRYLGSEQNDNDLVAWASSGREGRGTVGHTYAFQLPMNFTGPGENGTSGLGAIVLKVVRWTSISRPVFGLDGLSMYIGATGNQMRGWTGDTDFDQGADWSQDLSNDDSSGDSSAIPVAPTLSNDGKRLFVSTSLSEFHCLDAQTGERLWQVMGASSFLAGARVSPEDQRVYFIQSIDGRLNAYDQNAGEVLWSTSCDAFQEDCANSVTASFALSRSGQYIFYADVLGKVIALKLGDLVGTRDGATSDLDVFATPGGVFPVKNTAKTDPDSGPRVGGIVALVIFAMLFAGAAGAYILFFHKDMFHLKRIKRGRGRTQRQHSKNTPSNKEPTVPGADSCKESKITKYEIKVTGPQSICLDDSGEVSVHFVEDMSNDRPPMMLSGSNKVAPLVEDFSLGASVAV